MAEPTSHEPTAHELYRERAAGDNIGRRADLLEVREAQRAADYRMRALLFAIMVEQHARNSEGEFTYRGRALDLRDTLDGWIVEYDGLALRTVTPDDVSGILAVLRDLDDLADIADIADRARRS